MLDVPFKPLVEVFPSFDFAWEANGMQDNEHDIENSLLWQKPTTNPNISSIGLVQ